MDEFNGGQPTDSLKARDRQFSKSELRVFDHFRRYLMTPGNMLCLSGLEIESMRDGLDGLVKRRMLVPEGIRGAYCLTPDGFDVMRALTRKSAK